MLDLNKEDGGNRKCILVEQMNYMDTVTIPRLQKVLQREEIETSFLHMELRTYNIEYLERIESARTKEDLHAVYVDMARNAFLQFWFDRKNWEKDANYQTLTLEEQKIKLRELLDMNQLYLNTGDMYDARHSVSQLDQSITEKFYGKKN
jgi:adenine-specific DNA-methyltransferase